MWTSYRSTSDYGRAIADLRVPRILVTRGDLQSLKDDWLTDNVRVTDKQNNTAVLAEADLLLLDYIFLGGVSSEWALRCDSSP